MFSGLARCVGSVDEFRGCVQGMCSTGLDGFYFNNGTLNLGNNIYIGSLCWFLANDLNGD